MEMPRRFQDGYVDLVAEDFRYPPTVETRNRVAAALATQLRDQHMLGIGGQGNFETLRAVITASDETWARDIVPIKDSALRERWAFDTVDPLERYLQAQG